jgi:predicted ATP-dependent Lon-type protease
MEYPPPTNTSSIYNSISFADENLDGTNNGGGITPETGKEYFVSYPSAQGYETFPSGITVNSGLKVDTIKLSNALEFFDGTTQTSAGISETTADGLYASLTNANIITGETIFDYSNTNIINE